MGRQFFGKKSRAAIRIDEKSVALGEHLRDDMGQNLCRPRIDLAESVIIASLPQRDPLVLTRGSFG